MECKNCQKQLSEEDKYCNRCGARVVMQDISYRYLANEVSVNFFNVENNLILRTLKDLFVRPKVVIDGYIFGTRKRHISVVNFLALAITLSGIQIFLMQKFFVSNLDMSWMIGENNAFAGDDSFMNIIWEYQSILYVLFIPIYALIARITFFNYKKYTYLHQIIIIAYTQSQLSIVMLIPALIILLLGVNFFKFVNFFSFPFMIIYTAYCYKRLYQVSLWKIIGKTFLVILISGLFYFGFSILFAIILIVTGAVDLEQLIESQEASQSVTYIASSAINWTS